MASDDTPDRNVRIDGFDHFERIGSGGFSSVFRARQTSMGRDVAVKVLSADLSSDADRRTFERECHALGVLSRHPNIVTVYSESFTAGGQPSIVMELYDGNYRERLDATGPLPLPELLVLGVKIAGALQVAHESGILHRDIKPHNIFVSDYGEPALGDFGISTFDDERSVSAQSGLSVAYAAPEVLEDSSATAAADVYSLAATLYHLAEGAAPFASNHMRATVKRILTENAAPLSRRDAPTELSRALLRALSKEPTDRFPSAQRFAEALQEVQTALGLDRTEIPLRRPAGAREDAPAPAERRPPRRAGETTVERGRSAALPIATGASAAPDVDVAMRTPTPVRTTGVERDDSVETTVHRPRPAPVVDEVDLAATGPSDTRRTVAIGLGVVALVVVVVVGWVVAGGPETETAATTTVVTVADPDDGFFALVQAPPNIRIVGESGGATLDIVFDPVAGATEYEAESVAPSPTVGRTATSTTAQITVDLSIDDAPCWVVRTIGEGGRQSEASSTVCVSS